MFDVNGWELLALVVVAIVVLGPERLPEYAGKLGRAVRQVRTLAEGARASLKEQMGPSFDDVDWRHYDPRQYDPRRIVREALRDEPSPSPATSSPGASAASFDPGRPTPWDHDAT